MICFSEGKGAALRLRLLFWFYAPHFRERENAELGMISFKRLKRRSSTVLHPHFSQERREMGHPARSTSSQNPPPSSPKKRGRVGTRGRAL